MAIAIKAEFNTFDLADLTNDVVTVKEEMQAASAMPMAQPQATTTSGGMSNYGVYLLKVA